MAGWHRFEPVALREKLDAIRSAFEAQADPATRVAMDAADRDLALSAVRRTALLAGAIAPLFDLPNAGGGRVRLAALLRRGPVVVSFHRGDWCPYCRAELDGLSDIVGMATAFDASLVAVSPQSLGALRPEVGVGKLAFPVLSDLGARTAAAYGLAFDLPEPLRPIYDGFGHSLPRENGSGWVLPVPATYVVERTGRIALSHVDSDYRSRLEPDAVVAALQGLAGSGRTHVSIPVGNGLYESRTSTSTLPNRAISPSSDQDEEDIR